MLFPDATYTEKDYIKHILSLLKIIDADTFQCNICIPFPGSKLYQEMEARGELVKDWRSYDPSCSKLPYKSSLDLVKIRQQIILRYPFYNLSRFSSLLPSLDFRTLKALVGKHLENLSCYKRRNI